MRRVKLDPGRTKSHSTKRKFGPLADEGTTTLFGQEFLHGNIFGMVPERGPKAAGYPTV
jgi:hypothetical protein